MVQGQQRAQEAKRDQQPERHRARVLSAPPPPQQPPPPAHPRSLWGSSGNPWHCACALISYSHPDYKLQNATGGGTQTKRGPRVLKTVAITATIISVLVALFIKQLLCIDYMEHFKYIIIFLNHHIGMKSETRSDSIFVEWTCMKMDEECSAFTIIRHTEFPKSVPS